MIGRTLRWWLFGAVAGLAAVACSGRDTPRPEEAAAVAKDQYAIDSARMELDRASQALPGELDGTTWQLVQLRASHDSVIRPEAVAVYSVEFGRDGQVIIVGGCNRGGGSYTVSPPRGLSFGPLATTRSMCPPGSLSARFLRDFANMRAYELVGGVLYISLASGDIYQFVPEQFTAGHMAPEKGAELIFTCLDSTGASSRLFARFAGTTPDEVSLRRQQKTALATQVRSGSGAKYEGKNVMIWSKGRAAMVTWFGANLNCSTKKE
jgi:heat shock protein HslJ